MNHFGKYFSIKVFCITFIISVIIAITWISVPVEKETEHEKDYNIQSNTYETQETNNLAVSGVSLDISNILSESRYQMTVYAQSPGITTSGIIVNSNNISEETEKETQNEIEEVETEQPIEEEPERSNKLYCIVEDGITCNLDVKYQDYLWEMCEKYDVTEHYELFLAQMYHESSFNTDIISSTNDYGLMQINKSNHGWLSEKLGKDDFLDPYTSIEAGVYILSDYLKKYDDVQIALVCYNMGEGAVQKGTYSTRYSRGVLADMELLVELEN